MLAVIFSFAPARYATAAITPMHADGALLCHADVFDDAAAAMPTTAMMLASFFAFAQPQPYARLLRLMPPIIDASTITLMMPAAVAAIVAVIAAEAFAV